MRITHVVVTDAFAGTERYVCEVARRQAQRGHDVRVLGGQDPEMAGRLATADWRSASTVPAAVAALVRGARQDVVHAHLTKAELAVVLTSPVHRATVVTTRHIAARRGKTSQGRLAAAVVERGVDVEIAISDHVSSALERPPHAVLRHGVAAVPTAYDGDRRTVLVLQRLAPEKDTATAVRAWHRSGLDGSGWQLVVAGDGGERADLERLSGELGLRATTFLGHVDDVDPLLERAAVLLATGRNEGLGLSVLEAMAHGVPVAASGSGGHLELLPADWPWRFPDGDVEAAAQVLRGLSDVAARTEASRVLRARQLEQFEVERHVDALLGLYASRPAARRGPRR